MPPRCAVIPGPLVTQKYFREPPEPHFTASVLQPSHGYQEPKEITLTKKTFRLILMLLCAVVLIAGTTATVRAEWGGPPIIPQLPQQPLPQPPMPQPLPNNYLQPTLKDLPAAPQVVTGNGQGNFDASQGHDNTTGSTVPETAESQQTKPVTGPSGNETLQDPADPETPVTPSSEKSGSKTPWLLVAAVVAGAFFLGRRSKNR